SVHHVRNLNSTYTQRKREELKLNQEKLFIAEAFKAFKPSSLHSVSVVIISVQMRDCTQCRT
ncbi:hypothetical protein Taro_031203, partial [Colocasia esculenta]|nr:hypothetical protein [Colocasia esculenta]